MLYRCFDLFYLFLLVNYAGATAIPEPSSAALVVLGLAAVLAKRRRAARG